MKTMKRRRKKKREMIEQNVTKLLGYCCEKYCEHAYFDCINLLIKQRVIKPLAFEPCYRRKFDCESKQQFLYTWVQHFQCEARRQQHISHLASLMAHGSWLISVEFVSDCRPSKVDFSFFVEVNINFIIVKKLQHKGQQWKL